MPGLHLAVRRADLESSPVSGDHRKTLVGWL